MSEATEQPEPLPNLRVGLVGGGTLLAARREALAALPDVTVAGVLDTDTVDVLAESASLNDLLADIDVAFIGGPSGGRFMAARAAARQGVHTLLEWPPATSRHEGEAIMRLADEAGIMCRVSRPLRRHAVLEGWPVSARARVVTLHQRGISTENIRWAHLLADACDLVCFLAGSYSIQRIEAEAVRGTQRQPEAIAFSLRFHNGSYAQVSLQCSDAPATSHLYAGNRDHHLDTTLPDTQPQLLAEETRAFLTHLRSETPAAVPLLDALSVMRTVETLMQQLR